MVSWTTILLLGGTAVAVGAIAAYTKAGEGLRGVAGGLAEFVAAPIREGARAVGEIGLGVQQLGGGVGGAFAGIRSEFQAWIDMINKWQGVKPPYTGGGCITRQPEKYPASSGCPTDQNYVVQDNLCCWGTSIRNGARTLPPPVLPPPVLPPIVLPMPPRPISPEEAACLAATCSSGSRPVFRPPNYCTCF